VGGIRIAKMKHMSEGGGGYLRSEKRGKAIVEGAAKTGRGSVKRVNSRGSCDGIVLLRKLS